MPLTPNLTPGRFDQRGAMIVPRDIFDHVTKNAGWSANIATHTPATRQKYLESIKYWMDTNGACVIRNASSGKFAVIQDILACSTILPGNVVYKPTFAVYTIDRNPASGPAPTMVTVTITSDISSAYRVDFGDGVVTDYQSTDSITHEYTIADTYTISVVQLDKGQPLGAAKTITVTITGV